MTISKNNREAPEEISDSVIAMLDQIIWRLRDPISDEVYFEIWWKLTKRVLDFGYEVHFLAEILTILNPEIVE